MADFAKYRKNGGRVDNVATTDGWTGSVDADIFGVHDVGSHPIDSDNPPKWCDGNVFRAATAPEIAAWPAKEAEDDEAIDKKVAKAEIEDRKVLKAFMLIVMDEINILRAKHALADRTEAQLRTAIRNRIDSF